MRRHLLNYFRKNLSNRQLKEILIAHFFYGQPFSDLENKGREFAEKVVPVLCRKAAIKSLKWHLAQGHRCIIVSATFEFYFGDWANKMDVEHILCSKLELDRKGRITGNLEGENCFGPEKVRRLQAYLGPRDQYILYAYGDSSGDREMLAMADYPHKSSFTHT